MPIQIIAVEVVRWGEWWDDRWAVAIRYSNGRRQVFQLGNRLQAEKEVDRLRREAIGFPIPDRAVSRDAVGGAAAVGSVSRSGNRGRSSVPEAS